VPVILAVGGREVENNTVSMRRLGKKQTTVQPLKDVTLALSVEATPPDLL
jgi:threonyl-tRNA synthetase